MSDHYEERGRSLGALVTSKQVQYGRSVERADAIMRVLFPDGIQPHAVRAALLIVRVLDKLSRIAQRGADGCDLGGESPWKDIAGYGLIGWAMDDPHDRDVGQAPHRVGTGGVARCAPSPPVPGALSAAADALRRAAEAKPPVPAAGLTLPHAVVEQLVEAIGGWAHDPSCPADPADGETGCTCGLATLDGLLCAARGVYMTPEQPSAAPRHAVPDLGPITGAADDGAGPESSIAPAARPSGPSARRTKKLARAPRTFQRPVK